METQILDLLTKERVCVLALPLTGGSPHAATMHYSFVEEPLTFYFQTSNDTEKVKAIGPETVKAAVVVGFSELDWLTLQMRGTIRTVIDPMDLEAVYKIHYAKQPQAEQYKGLHSVFLKFTPTWWRFTDFTTEPETIISNQDDLTRV